MSLRSHQSDYPAQQPYEQYEGHDEQAHNGQTTAPSRHAQSALTDEDVYRYALRVAIIRHLVTTRSAHNQQVKATTAAAASAYTSSNGSSAAGASANNGQGQAKRESFRRTQTDHSSSSSSWSSNFSISDLFRTDGKASSSSGGAANSSPKYPERFVKVFESKIEDISRGYDRQYTDMLLRYTVGAYYGRIKEDKNKKLLMTSRKLEDLLLLFITTSTETLKKRCQPGDEWKVKLEEQVFTFLRIVEDCLRHRDVKHVPPELFTKLEGLKTKMSSKAPPAVASAENTAPASPAPETHGPMAPSMSAATSSASFQASFTAREMPWVRQLGMAFGVDEAQLQEDIDIQRTVCSEKVGRAIGWGRWCCLQPDTDATLTRSF